MYQPVNSWIKAHMEVVFADDPQEVVEGLPNIQELSRQPSKRRPLSEYPRETLFAREHLLPQARRSTVRRQRESGLGDSVVLDALTWLEGTGKNSD